MRDLKGKVAVVTGGASGIGRAMAERFAREGMKVVIADVEEKALAQAAAAIGETADVIAVRTDVSRWEDVAALADAAYAKFGATHVLCNNAGVARGGLAWEMSAQDWDWVLGVNMWGVVHGIRAFVPRMIAQGGGHVVNTASIAGLVSPPGMAAYCASKHAVVGLSECLHHEFAITGNASTMHVSVVCPAWVKTNIADATRNQPEAAKAAQKAPTAQEAMLDSFVRNAIAGGIPAAEVADQVLAAIVEERFWILTHPHLTKSVERRTRGIVEGKAPKFDPSAM
ncbi:MAG TPA: SDR family NAD(P)-dependent oxidoreductase [Polyangiaceae bacterium]